MNKTFYGWKVLAALFIAYFFANGMVTNTLPTLLNVLAKEFKWSPDIFSRAPFIQYMIVAVLSIFAGTLMDKFSTKKIMLVGSVIFLLGFISYYFIQNVTGLLISYALFALAMVLCGIISSMHILSKWFIKKRGMAVGIFLVASSLGGFILIPLVNLLQENYGWRNAVLILGIITFIFTFFPILFVVKNTPKDAGTEPDGLEPVKDTVQQHSTKPFVTIQNTIKNPTFYLLLLITGGMWFCILGVITHQPFFLTGVNTKTGFVPMLGFDNEEKAKIISVFYLCSIIGKLVFGYLSDRQHDKKKIMLLSTIFLMIGSFILYSLTIENKSIAWIYAIVFGFGFSGVFTMIQTLVADYYQGKHYGRILGLVTMIDTIAGALGAMVIGIMAKNNGGYHNGWLVLFIISVVGGFATILLKKPKTTNA
jgi:MFS transporter, OFA family, oxalate/formate antiporter